jgi:hypothetical protein
LREIEIQFQSARRVTLSILRVQASETRAAALMGRALMLALIDSPETLDYIGGLWLRIG